LLERISYEQEVESGTKAHLQNVDILVVAQTLHKATVFEEHMAAFVDGAVGVVILLPKTVRIQGMRAIPGFLDVGLVLV